MNNFQVLTDHLMITLSDHAIELLQAYCYVMITVCVCNLIMWVIGIITSLHEMRSSLDHNPIMEDIEYTSLTFHLKVLASYRISLDNYLIDNWLMVIRIGTLLGYILLSLGCVGVLHANIYQFNQIMNFERSIGINLVNILNINVPHPLLLLNFEYVPSYATKATDFAARENIYIGYMLHISLIIANLFMPWSVRFLYGQKKGMVIHDK